MEVTKARAYVGFSQVADRYCGSADGATTGQHPGDASLQLAEVERLHRFDNFCGDCVISSLSI
ncbi:hypothetical protein C454_00990 [Haloferax gibbonsii ATCC 33959]|uniref:Uncharacterized protein n=1 Tax=Haloferax gibbonsii (strain ATCC 33959 / DSM 4427 / JCM 8863 / NBRC 102184 / NCIMB 2188 / Ma 2.38) TaxID=1227459 RepID=M0HLT0_HALGM|nr:hypothetical protein C454_00990 [Haloferax gibbonsii ATCC 33959]